MNMIDFQQTGGFPLETNTLDAMQTAYASLNALGELAGDKTILKGCVQTGNTVSDGILYINGEVIEFRSGQVQSKIIIREDIVEGVFEDGISKPIYHIRHAKFGTGADAILWSEFKHIDPMLVIMQRLTEVEKKAAVFQQGGGMVFWNKPANQIPAGWQEVVDWRGRFPVGMDTAISEFDTLAKEGGEKEVTLTKSQMPVHKHTGNTNSAGVHTHTTNNSNSDVGDGRPATGNTPQEGIGYHTTNPAGNHTHLLNMNNAGGGQAHNNLPPYRTVLFIEYID